MKFFSYVKTITVLSSLTVLVACGTTNKNMDFAQSKTMINNDQEIIKILMGDEVAPRKDFITNNALDVSNLDI